MLRLPPTSIDLSEKDVAFHLQQLDIYHGLLKQGFNKADILRYMNEHAQPKQQHPSADTDDLSPASTVDLALLNSGPAVGHVSPPRSGDAKPTLSPDESEVAESRDASPREDASTPVELPPGQSVRHAPRQSSLLRFTELASPTPSDETDPNACGYNGPPARTYRPRTDTYSYSQSDISESDLANVKTADDLDHEAAISLAGSTMWAEAQEFIPSNHADLEDMPPILAHTTESTPTRRRHNGQDFNIHQDLDAGDTPPSTPPGASSDSSPLLQLNASTPGHFRNTPQVVRTAPRTQQLDGHFSVYNDALPSLSQPQTPLELERYPILSARDAAYTAPPGAMHSPNRSRHQFPSTDNELGSRTPTARAIDTRERRARELRRTVRVEAARLGRLRLVNGDEDDPTTATEQSDPWRNGLDGDRVGDENWEIESTVHDGSEQGIRIISGNARQEM